MACRAAEFFGWSSLVRQWVGTLLLAYTISRTRLNKTSLNELVKYKKFSKRILHCAEIGYCIAQRSVVRLSSRKQSSNNISLAVVLQLDTTVLDFDDEDKLLCR